MSFIWKNDFFLLKSTSSVNRSVAIFPSVVQAYTQPYSFGGRIKLIICQIRHELSVTVHKISTSWKKTLVGGQYTYMHYTTRVMLLLICHRLSITQQNKYDSCTNTKILTRRLCVCFAWCAPFSLCVFFFCKCNNN